MLALLGILAFISMMAPCIIPEECGCT